MPCLRIPESRDSAAGSYIHSLLLCPNGEKPQTPIAAIPFQNFYTQTAKRTLVDSDRRGRGTRYHFLQSQITIGTFRRMGETGVFPPHIRKKWGKSKKEFSLLFSQKAVTIYLEKFLNRCGTIFGCQWNEEVWITGFAETFKALADPARREILQLLKRERMSAGQIGSHFDMTGATISYHLNVLKKADLILETREKNFIYYELNVSVVEEVMLWLSQLK